MKALTLWRPWSDAIVHGPKRVENRTWVPPERLLGSYIALHAGKRYELGSWPVVDGYEMPESEDSPMGIVGVARLVGALELRGEKRLSYAALMLPDIDAGAVARRLWTLDEDPWWAGPVGWLLDKVTAIEPVSCRGIELHRLQAKSAVT